MPHPTLHCWAHVFEEVFSIQKLRSYYQGCFNLSCRSNACHSYLNKTVFIELLWYTIDFAGFKNHLQFLPFQMWECLSWGSFGCRCGWRMLFSKTRIFPTNNMVFFGFTPDSEERHHNKFGFGPRAAQAATSGSFIFIHTFPWHLGPVP